MAGAGRERRNARRAIRLRVAPGTGRCVALAEEWQRIDELRDMTEEADIAGHRQSAVEDELAAIPADTLADILAKAQIVKEWERQGITVSDDGPFIARSLLADLERRFGGAA